MSEFETAAIRDWERMALSELYSEYKHTLQTHRVKMRPAIIEIFDSEKYWGQWLPELRTIRMSRRLLMKHPWHRVVGILRHEMAHQLVDEQGGHRGRPHGDEFRAACEKLGVIAEFQSASANLQEFSLDWRTEKRDEVTERILDKVRKLLALAGSTNEHEAVLAMNRVRELYAKYNLEHLKDEKPRYAHLILADKRKRFEIHERKIMSILVGHFFVQALFGTSYGVAKGERCRTLEIIGNRENVLMAEYVYHFLLEQSARLVREKVKSRLGKLSRVALKSYRLGILEGFHEKLSFSEKPDRSSVTNSEKTIGGESRTVVQKALVAFQSDEGLRDYMGSIYPRLRMVRAPAQRMEASIYGEGKKAGQKLNLNRPLHSSSGNLGRLLGSKV